METQEGIPKAGTGAMDDVDTGTAVLAAGVIVAAKEAVAAAAALAAASQDLMLFTQGDEEQPGFSIFAPDQILATPDWSERHHLQRWKGCRDRGQP